MRGAITYTAPDMIIIQDESGALRIKPMASAQDTSIGDEVQVSGRVQSTTLSGTVKRLWSGSPPLPIAISPDEAAEGQYDLYLVEIGGVLTESHETTSALRLTLQGEHQFFTVVLNKPFPSSIQWPSVKALRRALQPGSSLEFKGILERHNSLDEHANGSFTILLRSSSDIQEIAEPPWWTPWHVLWLFACAAVLASIATGQHLRSIRARFRAVMEERSRIARDIHDTMAQGFAGIALQLQAAQRMLSQDLDSANRHLALALQMVRHSRSESHLTIQTLRALSHSDSLQTLLAHTAAQMTLATTLRINVSTHGSEPHLPYETATQIYRIGQQALANAVAHAEATQIELRLHYSKHSIILEVQDNGKGFDSRKILEEQAGNEDPHFGITGMNERAAAIKARLNIQSSLTGTLLRLEVPYP